MFVMHSLHKQFIFSDAKGIVTQVNMDEIEIFTFEMEGFFRDLRDLIRFFIYRGTMWK